jgi:hypothetical protein
VSGDLEHDLAARPASLAELVRVAGVGQRKDLGDVRVQPTGGDELGDRGQRKAVGLGERGGGAQAARRRRLGHVDRRVVRLDGRPVRTEADFAIAVEHDATLISSLAASEVPVREREPRRVDRLLDVRGAVGADDRHVHARAGQRPGDRELADDVAPLAREALELLHLLEVAAPHVALE